MWNHVSQPLTSAGSAVNIVIDELSRVAFDLGVRSTVVATGARDIELPRAELVPVDFAGLKSLAGAQLVLSARLADAIRGWMDLERRNVGRLYAPIAEALEATDGPIIVHDGYLGAAGLTTLRKRFPDRPIFLWMHQTLSPAYSPLEVRRFLSLADRVICVSDWIRHSLERAARWRETNDRLATVLNGVDTERFRPSESQSEAQPPAILFAGRIIKSKGPDVLAAALEQLHDENIDFRATFLGVSHPDLAGGSRYERALRARTSRFAHKVDFMPFRSNSELPALYREHQIMVVPSRFEEPCSLALLEGMASGLAIVAARRGGMPEVGRTSVQYFERTDGLAAALRQLLRDAEDRIQWGRLARARAEQLTWSDAFVAARNLIEPSPPSVSDAAA